MGYVWPSDKFESPIVDGQRGMGVGPTIPDIQTVLSSTQQNDQLRAAPAMNGACDIFLQIITTSEVKFSYFFELLLL